MLIAEMQLVLLVGSLSTRVCAGPFASAWMVGLWETHVAHYSFGKTYL